MILKILCTSLPVLFLVKLFYTNYQFQKKGIELAGSPPINRYIFFGTKYLLILVWIGMALYFWNIQIPGSFYNNSIIPYYLGISFWLIGFLLVYTGWFALGKNIRMGTANEKTEFVAKGLYKFSRNPMYLGVYLTFIGGSLFTLNFVFILLTIHIITVHHLITLAEEKKLKETFGEKYENYCKKVRRYV